MIEAERPASLHTGSYLRQYGPWTAPPATSKHCAGISPVCPKNIVHSIAGRHLAFVAVLLAIFCGPILGLTSSDTSDNTPAVTLVRTGIEQVGPDVLQLWAETKGPPSPGWTPNDFVLYVWQLETLRGSPPYPAGIDPHFEIRFEVKNIPDLCGGFVRTLKQQQSDFRIPAMVDGNRVIVRVTLPQIGTPNRFRWKLAAYASGVNAPHATEVQEYQTQNPAVGEDQVARVVIQPTLILRSGVTQTTPWIIVQNSKGRALSLDGRAVELFAYSDRLEIQQRSIRAVPGKAGAAGITATVDGVVSCNVAWAMVGSLEMHPAVLHLDSASHPSDSFALSGFEANGNSIVLDPESIQSFTDQPDYCTISNQTVRMLDQSGLSYSPHAYVHSMIHHYWPENVCLVRFVRFSAPLMPTVELRGEHVSFWCPPLKTSPVPELFQFKEMAERYGLTKALDQGYLLSWQLAGAMQFKSGRQHYAVLCNDDMYQLCGGNGNPSGIGFDPREFTSCVFLADWTGGSSQAQVVGPNFVAMLHELGHNCLSVSKPLLQTMLYSRLNTDPFYNEAFATLFALYAQQQILKAPDHFGLNTSFLEGLTREGWPTSISDRRHYFVDIRLGEYLQEGAHYPDSLNADVVEGILTLLGEKYGWDMYRRFFSIFYPPDEPWDFTPQNETERATFFIAATSAAAKTDARSLFRSWGFPCDQALYEHLLPILTWRAAQRDGGLESFICSGYKGDVAPRPDGNGGVTTADWEQAGRFVAGLETAAAGCEFQRADTAPAPCGDGKLTITDWVKTGRYAAGFDALVSACGPTSQSSPNATSSAVGLMGDASRVVRIVDSSATPGDSLRIAIELVAQGDENALGFSLTYDTALLSNPQAVSGSGASSASFIVNPNQVSKGRIGVAIALPAGQTFSAGTRQLVIISFTTVSSASGLTTIGFGDQPIARETSDALANPLAATYVPGQVALTYCEISQVWPVEGAAPGKTSTLWALVRNNGSVPQSSNSDVWFYVEGPGWTNNWVGSAPIGGLPPGSSKWYRFDWPVPSTAVPGNYTYKAQAWTTSAISGWSHSQAFIVSPLSPPGKAILVSPSGTISTGQPTYTWKSEATATWYFLWVNDNTANNGKIQKWFTAAEAGCGSGIGNCAVTPATSLASGAARWWIQTWNEAGYGPWSDGMTFTVDSTTTSGLPKRQIPMDSAWELIRLLCPELLAHISTRASR